MKRTRRRPVYARLGTVSEATLRPEDLLPAFLGAVEGLRLTREERATVRAISRSVDNDYQGDGDARDENMSDDVDSLTTILDSHAPPFCYFGTLEGDGACFGFWVSLEAVEQAEHEGEVWRARGCDCPGSVASFGQEHTHRCASRIPKGASYRLVVSDHGNMTLYTRRGREVWGVV